MTLLAAFAAACMEHHEETNGHALPASAWRQRLFTLEGIYREMIRSPIWREVSDAQADECHTQLQYTRNQLGLADRRESKQRESLP